MLEYRTKGMRFSPYLSYGDCTLWNLFTQEYKWVPTLVGEVYLLQISTLLKVVEILKLDKINIGYVCHKARRMTSPFIISILGSLYFYIFSLTCSTGKLLSVSLTDKSVFHFKVKNCLNFCS